MHLTVKSYFLLSFLKSIEKSIMRLRVGSGLPNIQIRDLENIIISIPSDLEQEKISKIFFEIDNQISLQQQKLDAYKKLKKTLLDKMFI
ncbi:restriction endonuclease subunit S [Helcococcus ovis]|uniref:restriction endonuclease subunit S n=2 Tax=Helcococcus ovis TaxID=72026 RepID=UPI002468D502|nr:restriction endonuclease subunit S [Helcococcus ovis]